MKPPSPPSAMKAASKRTSIKRSTRQRRRTLLVVALGVAVSGPALGSLAGCGRQSSQDAAQDLVRRELQRESSRFAEAKTAEERLAAAEKLFQSGAVSAAQAELRPLMISDPDNPQLVLLLAQCEAELGDKVAAAEMLQGIGGSDPDQAADAWWLAAQWLSESGEYAAAYEQLERILDVRGDLNRVHHRAAAILNHLGRRTEAADHLRALARSGDISEKELFAMNTYTDPFIDGTAVDRSPASGVAPEELVQAMRLRSEGDLEAARRFAERLVVAHPDSTPIAAFLGRVLTELEDEERLRSWMKALPEGIDREPNYWYSLGIWSQRNDQHREAVRCLGETVARDDTDRLAYLAFARSLTRLEEDAAAGEARQRYEWLYEAAQIAKQVAREPGTMQELNRMAELLDQLHRPWEAVGWRAVALQTHGTTEAEVAALNARRDELAEQDALGAAPLIRTCGIVLDRWPLPDREELAAIAPSAPRANGAVKEDRPIVLQDVAAEAELSFTYANGDDPSDDERLLHQMTGGGIGVVDFDLDGWPDLYLAQAGGDAFDAQGSQPNQLHRNLAGERFIDVTSATETGDLGYGQGIAVADINQDGFPDLLVANIGPNVAYVNNGDGTFTQRGLPSHDAEGRWTTSLACGDLNGDQLPEIVEVNYIDDPTAFTIACTPSQDICNPSLFQPAADRVWSTVADGSLRAWDGCEQLAEMPNYGFAAVIANFDGEAGNDLFIANDTLRNHYWLSQQEADDQEHRLVEVAQVYGCATGLLGERQGCMGVALGDFDRNGRMDLHVTNFWNQAADLYLQQQEGWFVNGNVQRGVYEPSRPTVGWGTQAVDFDRDGWLDLAVLNGHLIDHRHRGQPYHMRPQLFRGDAEGFRFIEPAASDGNYWATPALGRTMAVLDWNGDSALDLVTNHLDAPVALLENRTESGNGLLLELVGTRSERDATGAAVKVICGDQVWHAWVTGGDGFLCSNQSLIGVGMGDAETIDVVEVTWPSGVTHQYHGLEANHRYLLTEGEPDAHPR